MSVSGASFNSVETASDAEDAVAPLQCCCNMVTPMAMAGVRVVPVGVAEA